MDNLHKQQTLMLLQTVLLLMELSANIYEHLNALGLILTLMYMALFILLAKSLQK